LKITSEQQEGLAPTAPLNAHAQECLFLTISYMGVKDGEWKFLKSGGETNEQNLRVGKLKLGGAVGYEGG